MVSGVVKALEDERLERSKQLETLEEEWAGKKYSDEARERYNALNAAIDEFDTKIELAKRDERKKEILARAENGHGLETPQMKRPGAVEDSLIFDVRSIQADWMDPQATSREFVDRAHRAVEKAEFPSDLVSREDAQGEVDKLLRRSVGGDGAIARHVLATGSPAYKSAFGKMLSGQIMTAEESDAMKIARAMSLTGTSGGFGVPFELDPTIIPTSNLAINPFRAIARVEQITGDEWRGVASSGITAAYAAEATAATDAAPTLAQPTVSTEKARAFVPFSIEVGQDFNGLQAELAGLLRDSKDELEAAKFAVGTGTNEPFGVVTGATTVYTAAATNAITAADIYGWEAALGPRFRPNRSIVANGAILQRIRQVDTAGGSNMWADSLRTSVLSNQVPTPGLTAVLLNAPVYEASGMSSAMTTGQLIAVIGDFRYYVIAERLGLTLEVIPHLFDTTNNMPTGQRGLYAYWRNGAKVVDANAFRTLKLA